jgi:serine/threonine protein kinase
MGQIVESVAKNQMMNKRLQRTKDNLCNYKLYNVIGRGAFGEVRLARNLIDGKLLTYLDQIVAIKRLQKKNIL